MDKFRNKYRIPSARWANWDYGSNGAYFITICTQNRDHFFGEIMDMNVTNNGRGAMRWNDGKDAMHCVSTNPTMKLSDIGKIVETEWLKTFEIDPI